MNFTLSAIQFNTSPTTIISPFVIINNYMNKFAVFFLSAIQFNTAPTTIIGPFLIINNYMNNIQITKYITYHIMSLFELKLLLV